MIDEDMKSRLLAVISNHEVVSADAIISRIIQIFSDNNWVHLDGEQYHIVPGDPALYYVSKRSCQRLDEQGMRGLSWRETYYVKAVMAMANHIIKEDEDNDLSH